MKTMKHKKILKNLYTLFICSFLFFGSLTVFAVTTPCGETVPNAYSWSEGLSDTERYANDMDAESIYGITLLYEYDSRYSSTGTYNCHGYAWHMKEGGGRRWINFPQPPSAGNNIYVTSGCYVECSASEATKVCYQYDHSAVRINASSFKSKWGDGPLCLHTPGNVPVGYGSAVKYYRLRDAGLTANFSYQQIDPCGTIRFTDTSTVKDCAITSWSWNFGDGTTSTQRHPVHAYASKGNKTVILTITGDWGAAPKSITKTVNVPDCSSPVTVLTPGSGQTLQKNTWFEITWVPANVTGNVALYLYQNGSFVGTIAGTVSNDGDRDWFLDELKRGVAINPGSNFQVEVVSKQFPKVKGRSGYFTITN